MKAAATKSLQSCPTLCDPIDGSLPGSAVPGILQARTVEWVAISFSNAGKGKVKVKSLSRVQLFVTPWTAAYQAPPSMGFSRQEYWSGVPSPSLLCESTASLYSLPRSILTCIVRIYIFSVCILGLKYTLVFYLWSGCFLSCFKQVELERIAFQCQTILNYRFF